MRGFILLEVLVSIMISSMIFMSLMSAVFQLSKARIVVDDAIDVYSRVSTIMGLMEQDFGGATIPVQAELPRDKKQAEQQSQKKETAEQGKHEEVQSSEKAAGKDETVKPIKNIFYGTRKNNDIHLLSCITNNPTAVYWSDRAGKAKPRVARVVYTLVPDPTRKESFLLKRQEGSLLELDLYTHPEKSVARAYEVAEGIKQFSVAYLYLEKKEEAQKGPMTSDVKNGSKEALLKKEEPVKKQPSEKPDYKSKPEWGVFDQKNGEEKNLKEPLMPLFMAVHLVMWNSTYKKEYIFDFIIEICAQEAEQIKQAQMRYVEDKKPVQKEQESSPRAATPIPVQEAPVAPQKISDLTAYNNTQQGDTGSQNYQPKQTFKEPIIVASESNVSKSAEEQLADTIIEGFMQEVHNKVAEKIEEDNRLSDQEGVQTADQTVDDFFGQEQIDMPAGRIDLVQDGEKTYVVYQGPIPITQGMIGGLAS